MNDERGKNNFIYKSYDHLDGEVLEFTQGEFERIVELFKMLEKQNRKIKGASSEPMQFEHEALSPEKAF